MVTSPETSAGVGSGARGRLSGVVDRIPDRIPGADVGATLLRQARQRRRVDGGASVGTPKKGSAALRSALQGRLEVINLMECHADGTSTYMTMTLRNLYNYAMKAITTRPDMLSSTMHLGASRYGGGGVGESRVGSSPKSPMLRTRPSVAPPPLTSMLQSSSVGIMPPPHPPPPPPPPLLEVNESGGSGASRITDAVSAATDPSNGADNALPPLQKQALPPEPPGCRTPSAGAASVSASSLSSSGHRVSFFSSPHNPHSISVLPPPPMSTPGRRTATLGLGGVASFSSSASHGAAAAGMGMGVGMGGLAGSSAMQQQAHVTYRERLGGYLHPRDMRRLVTPFSTSNAPELMVRRHVMLLNFDPLRAIVLRDRLLVIVPTGADSILMSLEQRLRGGLDEVEAEVFGEADVDLTDSARDASENMQDIPVEAVIMDSPWDGKGRTSSGGTTSSKDAFLNEASGLAGMGVVSAANTGGKERNADGAPPPSSDGGGPALVEPKEVKGTEEAEGVPGGGDGDGSNESSTASESSDFGPEADEWEDIEGKNWIEMSFELQAVDAVLSCASTMLASEACSLEREVRDAMAHLRGEKRISNKPGEHAQERLRVQKDKVGEMESRVQGFVRAMNLVLDEDEDMALMNLSRLLTHPERFIQPVSQDILEEESDEPELILEGYLQQALSTVNALNLLKGQISSTEEQINMMLDTVRNRLLYINTFLSLISLCVATGSFIGSVFGMNLLNGLEEDDDAFVQVVIGTVVGGFIMLCVLCVLFIRAMSIRT